MPALDSLIGHDYQPLSRETGARHALRKGEHIIVLPGFLIEEGVRLFREEALRLLGAHGKRKDLSALNGSPRHMTTVNGRHLLNGEYIPGLLRHPALLEYVTGIVGERVVPYGDTNEACVLIELNNKGDTHGAHCDQFRGVLNVAVAMPDEAEDGGVLAYVPGVRDPAALRGKDRREVWLKPGDAYVMDHTDDCVHEVTPLTRRGSRRIIASLAFSDPKHAGIPSQSSAQLFDGCS